MRYDRSSCSFPSSRHGGLLRVRGRSVKCTLCFQDPKKKRKHASPTLYSRRAKHVPAAVHSSKRMHTHKLTHTWRILSRNVRFMPATTSVHWSATSATYACKDETRTHNNPVMVDGRWSVLETKKQTRFLHRSIAPH